MTFIFKIDFVYLYFIQASQVKGASCQDYVSNKGHTEKLTQSSKSCTAQGSEITTRNHYQLLRVHRILLSFVDQRKFYEEVILEIFWL